MNKSNIRIIAGKPRINSNFIVVRVAGRFKFLDLNGEQVCLKLWELN